MKRARRAGLGLTLVEVMVALAVLSLIVLALGASLRGLAQSGERVDRRVAAIDEMRLSAALLRELLATALPERRADAGRAPRFAARADGMEWIAVMPPRHGAGGAHAFRLAVERLDDDSTALVLRYAPWSAQDAIRPDWSTAASRVLAHGIERLAVSYGGQGLNAGWQPAWPAGERLPPRVRLDVTPAAGAWPPIVLPLRVPARAGGQFVIGGSGG
ncbi:MAG: hypothetical protein ABS84_01945 [Rubrivivax sp. SCN 71-131]|nr:MAG: hypothetical protein ABS84_01945 [Rubrivivax sp. SCN 71-131]